MAHPKTVKPSEMQLGDVVSPIPAHGPWASCIVEKIDPKGGVATLYRPYGTTADFSMSGGSEGASSVICYMGLEEYPIYLDSNVEWTLHERRDLK